MIKIDNKKRCCGCLACLAVCPAKCISAKEDSEGFYYPVADEEKCLHCGLCEKVCPYNNPEIRPRKPKNIVGAWNKDETIRRESSSGGVFSALAEYVINSGGKVFGAVFDENWNIRHECADDIAALGKMRISKYAQSDMKDCFPQIKTLLKKEVPVLFTGTPCQVAGLRSFLGKDHPLLYTADLVCHGVPSPGIWQQYLREVANGERIVDINFRDKKTGWRNYTFSITTDTGREFSAKKMECLFIRGFLADLYIRPSCFSCRFRNFASQSDITLSDFWSIKNYLPEMDDNMGASLVYINSEKGKTLMDSSNCLIEELETMHYPYAVCFPAPYNPAKKKFYRMLQMGSSVESAVLKTAGKGKPIRKISELLIKFTYSFKAKRNWKLKSYENSHSNSAFTI